MAQLRLFVAVLLSDALRNSIARAQDQFKKASGGVKWVAPENLHVTLKFLGGVDEERLDDINTALSASVEGFQTFDLKLAGAGAFPGLSRPQTIWIAAKEGTEHLRRLAESVESRLEAVGFPKEERKFKAHITIGRAKDLKDARSLSDVIKNYENEEFGSQTVDRIALMKSDLRKEGPIYSALREFMLPGA
jgi:2'-5' RNA ligase